MRIGNRAKSCLTILLSVFMIVGTIPALSSVFGGSLGNVYAAASAAGGEITSGNAASATKAFGSAATAKISGNTLTITLNQDVTLSNAVKFVMGSSGDKIILSLNGHTITGAAGKDGTDYNAALGRNAVELAADEFDLEIKGPGSVIGGKGAVYLGSYYGSEGLPGGSGIYFCERVDKLHGVEGETILGDEGYHPDKLEYGLSITGGANIVGGAGADVDYDDWIASVKAGYMGVKAGDGGAGIGQVYSGTKSHIVADELSYAKIIIDNGSVRGGAGGNADMGNHIFTRTEIQKIPAIRDFMADKEANYHFDNHVTENIDFGAGDGASGIEFYAGRKYVDVEKNGSVFGGTGGKVLCGEQASLSKKVDSFCGSGGYGIHVCGDTGLTNKTPALSDSSSNANYWGNKTKDSDDVGIYVAGTVTGGDALSTTLLNDRAGNGGDAIYFNLDKISSGYSTEFRRTQFDEYRGILLVDTTGKVTGGAAGASGATTIKDMKASYSDNGGYGIVGGSSGSPAAGTSAGAGHVVIRGTVCGGYGSNIGGDGVSMTSEREYIEDGNSKYFTGFILGDGTIRGGDSGEWSFFESAAGYSTGSDRTLSYEGKAVCGVAINAPVRDSTYHPGSLTVSSGFTEKDGKPVHIKAADSSFKVSAEMTPFNDKPSTSNRLKCTVTTPSGYTGKVYIKWVSRYSGDEEEYDLEGANGAINDFALLSDSDYPYGIYKNVFGSGSSQYFMEYFAKVGTVDRMVDRLQYNGSRTTIYCYATLEDGRTVKSNEIWFDHEGKSETGWSGGSGSGQSQAEIDQAAADKVQAMIDALPSTSSLTLADADAVEAARKAYDALTDDQKKLLEPYVYLIEDLENAEKKIDELQGEQAQRDEENREKANEVIALIENLPDISLMDPESIDYAESVAEAKAIIEETTAAYNNLTDDQKKLVDSNGATAYLNTIVDDYNKRNPADPIGTPVSPAESVKNITPEVILSAASFNFTNKVITPSVTVKDGDTRLKPDQYTVTYSKGRKEIGTYKVTVTLKGNYRGTRTVSFTIGPKSATISKPKAAKKAITVKWKKQTAKMPKKQITGYQVQYSTKKNFSGAKTKTVKGAKKTSVKITKLKSKTTYYVRVRTYMKVGGKTYYSTWSGAKSAKAK